MSYSVQFSHSVVSDSLRPHESQHTRPPCPSPTPRVHSDSHPSSQWCHPAISSSVVPFFSCPQSIPASVFSSESSLHMRWPNYWSFSFSIIPSKEIPGLIFRMGWLDLRAVQGILKRYWKSKVRSQEILTIIGKCCLGVQNEARQKLTVCQENMVTLPNTFFQRYKKWLYTWTSRDEQYQNQVDYVLCTQRWRSSIQSVKIRPGADCGLDHELFIAKFWLKLKKVWKTTRPLRYDLNQIPYDYTVQVVNGLKALDLEDRIPEELWTSS